MKNPSYYGEATIVHNGREYRVFADLEARAVDTTTLGGPPTQTLGSWGGSIDMRLGGPFPARPEGTYAILRLPDGRDAKVQIGNEILATNEPARWPIRGISYPPFVAEPGQPGGGY